MIRSVELELKTISEANAREHWHARKDRRSEQRDAVRAALRGLGPPPLFSLLVGGWTKPNPIRITLTRIAPGELDDDNLVSAFKAVRDEVAAWFGIDDKDKRLRWACAQERSAPGVYKIRLEIADATPGDDIRVQLATQAERDSGALRRVHPKRKPEPNGQGSLALMRSWCALPWEQAPCEPCGGTGWERRGVATTPQLPPCADCNGTGLSRRRSLAALPRFATLDDPPETLSVPVPAEHLGRWGAHVTLHRRRFKSRATGLCWLYEHRNERTTKT